MMTIEERLENMERELGRQKRRNRWMLGTIMVVVGGLIALKLFETTPIQAWAQEAGASKQIRANEFVLEDAGGKIRARLGTTNDSPGLTLWDENGKCRAGLGIGKDGPSIALWDKNGKRVVRLWAYKDGSRLALTDEESNCGLALGATNDRSEILQLDKNGKLRIRLWTPFDGPKLSFWDENEILRAGLVVGKDASGLALFDINSMPRFVAGKTKFEWSDGKTIEYPESSLVLFGPDGKPIWSAIK